MTDQQKTEKPISMKEITAHIRKRIKHEKIKARVYMSPTGSAHFIGVCPPAPGIEFSEHEQRTIRHIAKCNRLTWIRGMEIDVERMTNPFGMHFHMPAEAARV